MTEYDNEARELLQQYRAAAEPSDARLEAIRRRVTAPGAEPIVPRSRQRRVAWAAAAVVLVAVGVGAALVADLPGRMGVRLGSGGEQAAMYDGQAEVAAGRAAARGSAGQRGGTQTVPDSREPGPGTALEAEGQQGLDGVEPAGSEITDPAPESRSPSRRARTRPVRAKDSAAPADDLSAQMALLSGARTALRRGHVDRALRTLAKHRRRFPKSALVGERALLEVSALCKAGRVTDARDAAARFARANAGSAFVDRVRRACPQASNP